MKTGRTLQDLAVELDRQLSVKRDFVVGTQRRKEILDKCMQKAKSGKEPKNPVMEFMQSLHWITPMPEEYTEEAFESAVAGGAKFGFPATGLKQSAVSAAYRAGLTKDKVSVYGSFHIIVSAQEAGAEIESCKNSEGFITPESVLEKAKAVTSIIHSCFEWNDKNAAKRYRLHQAGELIRNIVTVNIADNDETSLPVRAFVNIKSEAERGYKSISAVVNNQGEYDYMMDCARNELKAFTQKYSALEELRGVISAIREVLV